VGSFSGGRSTPDEILVADGFYRRVLAYLRDGTLDWVAGRAGSGPGELETVTLAFRLGDSMVGVADEGKKKIVFFHRDSSIRRRPVAYEGIIRSSAIDGERVWFGSLNGARQTGLAIWSPAAESVRYLAPWPASYRQSPALAGINTGVLVAADGERIAYSFSGTDDVILLHPNGERRGAVQVPRRARRGVPADIVERMRRKARDYPSLFAANSVLFGLGWRTDGGLSLVHHDQVIDGTRIRAKVFVSVLSPDMAKACVDAAVPVSEDSQPISSLRGDTLFVLQQMLVSDTTAVPNLRAYTIDTTACSWVPTSTTTEG
jgi:hypothetical protein